MFECQQWHGWHSSQNSVLLPSHPTHRLQTSVLCHPPYVVHCTKVLWSWLWLQSFHQQNSLCTPYHHQRHLRFSEKALRGQLFPHTNLPLVLFFPSILKPRAGNFPEQFNGCRDPVQGADQQRYIPIKPMSFPNIASSECLPKSQAPTLLEGAQNKIKTGC